MIKSITPNEQPEELRQKPPGKKLIILIITAIIITGSAFFILPRIRDEKILMQAIYLKKIKPSAKSSQWGKLEANFTDKIQESLSPSFQIFNFAYSRDSLSSFLATLKPGIPHDYELEMPPAEIMNRNIIAYIKKANTVISLNDITEQRWQWERQEFTGSFSFETRYGLKGRCIFKGCKNKINQLVIARKGSDKLEDGYAVFGCLYGVNVLRYDHVGSRLEIPAYDQDGEYITAEKRGSSSYSIGLKKDGTYISSNGNIGRKRLIFILKQQKTKDSDQKIFLWIEKNCPESEIDDLKSIIKPFAYNVYEVFYNEKKGQILARKLYLNSK